MASLETEMMTMWEKTKRFRVKVGVTLYVLIAVYTFGHAASEHQRIQDARTCVLPNNPTVINTCGDPANIVGFFGGVFWPLYWAWEFQS